MAAAEPFHCDYDIWQTLTWYALLPGVVIGAVMFIWFGSVRTTIQQTTIAAYQQTQLEIARGVARSVRQYVLDAWNDSPEIETDVLERIALNRFIKPMYLPNGGGIWVFAPKRIVFESQERLNEAQKSGDIAAAFGQQATAGHYVQMVSAIQNRREGAGWYLWSSASGPEIAAWTPVEVGPFIWMICVATPLSGIMANSGATQQMAAYGQSVLLMTVATYGALLWVGVNAHRRRRALDALRASEENARRFQDHLKTLHAASITLSQCDTVDTLCRQAVAVGQRDLGFDRVGIWFFDEDFAYAEGAYGTDEKGSLRDEHGQRFLIYDSNYERLLKHYRATGHKTFHWERSPLYDAASRMVGYGELASALLLDGDKPIGAISVDNLLTGRPIDRLRLEMLALYGATLGRLFAQKRMQDALRASEEKFHRAFEISPDAITITRMADSRCLDVNRGFELHTGYQRAEVIGKTTQELNLWCHPEQRSEMQRQMLASGEVSNMEAVFKRKDGTTLTGLLSARWIEFGGEPCALIIVRDISDRKAAENEILRLNADLENRVAERTAELLYANQRLTELDRLKSKFIADVTHELRTPITTLNTSLYLLERSGPDKQPIYLERLKEHVDRLVHFVNHILDLSRLELMPPDPAFAPVDLNEAVRQVVSALSPRVELAGLRLLFEPDAALPPVRGELNQLSQVVTNLTTNAIKYTLEGEILIRTYHDRERNCARMQISDTGIGIHPDDIPHLFDRFYRGQHGQSLFASGSGLGLSIVREIVELHDGSISVESQVDVGSTFTVCLPLWAAAETPAQTGDN